jgi:LPS export ABC transporter protein LptC
MRKRTGQRLRHGTGAAALAIAVVAAACGRGDDPVAERLGDLPADQVVFDIEYYMNDLGVLRAHLRADTAYVWEDSARTVLFPVELTLYDRNGAESAHLTADEGEVDTGTNNTVARGNVVLVTTAGDRRIMTEELHYEPRRGRIWSDVHTVMLEGDTRLEGAGFRANNEMTDVEVFESTGENIEIEF